MLVGEGGGCYGLVVGRTLEGGEKSSRGWLLWWLYRGVLKWGKRRGNMTDRQKGKAEE